MTAGLLGGVMLTSGLVAQESRWRPLGPEGGEIRALAADPHEPGVVYAGTRGGGVFKSLDGGESWSPSSEGLVAATVHDLAVDPTTPVVVYAATDGGVFKSADGGASWSRSSPGLLADEHAAELTFDPADPGTLFVLVSNGISGSWTLFESTDRGASWREAGGGNLFTAALAASPTSPTTLYAGSFHGVYRSTDGGASWALSRDGLPLAVQVVDLLVDPLSPTTVYTAVGPLLGPLGPVYKSTDGGATWSPAAAGLPQPPTPESWTLAADPAAPGTLYAGGPAGLFKSTDGAASWAAVPGEPAGRALRELLFDPATSNLFAGVSRFAPGGAVGVLRSTDGGESWQTLKQGLTASFISSVAPHPGTAGSVLAATDTQVVASADGGATWTDSSDGITVPWLGAITRDPVDPATLYATGGDGPFSPSGRVFRSTDGGATWAPRGEGCCLGPVVVDPREPSTLYGHDFDRVLKSTDGGATWQDVSGSLCPVVSAVAVQPAAPSAVLVGCSRDSGLPVSPPFILSDLYISVDGGTSWSKVFDGPDGVGGITWTLAFDPGDPAEVFAGAAGFDVGGVFRSVDGGRTWSAAGLAGLEVQSLGIDPFQPGYLYAGTFEDGLFWSPDRGETWHPLNAGLLSGDVRAFGFGPDALWAATSGGGVHVLDREAATPCAATATALCLDGRFRAEVEFEGIRGGTAAGRAAALTEESGYFWFFGADNLEVAVKTFDGRAVNGHFWFFNGSLSDVGYTLTVTDTATGRQRRYHNPAGRLASAGDLRAFADLGAGAAGARGPTRVEGAAAPVAPIESAGLDGTGTGGSGAGGSPADEAALALAGGRFRVEVAWRDFRGREGAGEGAAVSDRSGYFWFFRRDSVEVAVKILDGRRINGHFWVFLGSLTNVAWEVTVTDLETGTRRTYENALGEFGSRADTGTF